ncbi:MAG: DUF2600 family protein [Solirubrobacterales bacterium]
MSSPSLALGVANARYWSTVAPLVRAQLAHWERRAGEIPDPVLQRLATSKLRKERFNVEVAATLATLAPRAHRRSAVEAIVALQVMYDYLDLLTEQPSSDGLTDGRQLFAALCDVLAPEAALDRDYYRHHPHSDDGGYLGELASTARRAFAQLPAAAAVAETAQRSAERCAEAQVLSHAAARSKRGSGGAESGGPESGGPGVGDPGVDELERWAGREAAGTALQWPEFLAGAAASVIAVHALIATAADRHTGPEDARAIDAVYLSIGALTMLDSLVDHREDIEAGELGYLRCYDGPEQMARRLVRVATDAAARARLLPNAAHHVMTLVGVVAYYASAPSAGSPVALPVVKHMRRELRPTIVPTLALMRAWRLAKRVRRIPTRLAATLLGVLAAGALLAAGPAEAHTLRATDTAHLHYISAAGSLLYEEGRASGTLPGSMRVHFNVGSTLSGSFTIYTRGGTIRGHGEATPHGAGIYESFAGQLIVTGGTGRYAHARGRTGLYGTFDRQNYALLVQTTGTLTY